MKDFSDIRCLAQAFRELADAEAEERKAREEADSPSWGYHGQSYFEAIDTAAEELEKRLNEYIDARIESKKRWSE